MKYQAKISILPMKELLDPQGKAVKLGLSHLGIISVEDVRIGKFITLEIVADNQQEAERIAETACKKLLVNPIMEEFKLEVIKI